MIKTLATPVESWNERFEQAHEKLAVRLGFGSADQLLLTPGCTSALSVGIADHDWQAGERLLTSVWEHHAVARPCELLKQRGVQIVQIPGNANLPFCLESFERELKAGPVRLVAATAACNVTGVRLPLEEIVELAHRFGALVLIDAAQTVGWQDFTCQRPDMTTSPVRSNSARQPHQPVQPAADLIAFGSHKGLLSPWGLGGLYIADHVEMSAPAARCSIDAKRDCRSRPGYCDVGSVDQSVLLGLATAVDWLTQQSSGKILAEQLLAREQLADQLRQYSAVQLYGEQAPHGRLPTIALNIRNVPSTEIARDFKTHGITVSAGWQCATWAHQALGTEQQGVVRMSFGAMTTMEEIAEVQQRIPRMLGARIP